MDIETTGGFAGRNRITEVAIYFHDGEKITGNYQTLINPGQVIPAYITGLTGISQPMVAKAPTFQEVAQKLYDQLHDKVFVAHNVHFDYSFLKREFDQCSLNFSPKKVCTVRLSRHLLPGMKSYGLGKLCEQLDIPIKNRHRAGGDAEATAILFDQLLKKDEAYVHYAIKRTSGETKLPPNLPKEEYESLPEEPGVYYFLDGNGEVIYVGKAINLKKRISSHFSGTSKNRRNQYIRNEIHHINYELTGNELVALLLESQEIKRIWPKYNRAQKFRPTHWAVYSYEDRDGYLRLNVNKTSKGLRPITVFNNHADAWHTMIDKIKDFELCPKYCGIQKTTGPCFDYEHGNCLGACDHQETPEVYNKRVKEAISSFQQKEKSFIILGAGRHDEEQSLVLVDNGAYHGFGFIDYGVSVSSVQQARFLTESYKSTAEIESYIESYLNSQDSQIIELAS